MARMKLSEFIAMLSHAHSLWPDASIDVAFPARKRGRKVSAVGDITGCETMGLATGGRMVSVRLAVDYARPRFAEVVDPDDEEAAA